MTEIWKDIKGYEGFYQASTLGRILAKERQVFHSRGGMKTLSEKILSKSKANNGYSVVCLCKEGKVKQETVHRIIAKTFIPNPEDKPQVNHINGIKTDNRIENLEWATSHENNKHAFAIGIRSMTKGQSCSWAKLTRKQAMEIKYDFPDMPVKELAQKYNVSYGAIYGIIKKRNWKHI